MTLCIHSLRDEMGRGMMQALNLGKELKDEKTGQNYPG